MMAGKKERVIYITKDMDGDLWVASGSDRPDLDCDEESDFPQEGWDIYCPNIGDEVIFFVEFILGKIPTWPYYLEIR